MQNLNQVGEEEIGGQKKSTRSELSMRGLGIWSIAGDRMKAKKF